jgi:hypothetical protein
MAEFVVGIGSDFYDSEGRSKLRALRESFLNVPSNISTVTLPVVSGPVFPPELLMDIDAVVMLGGGRLTAESLAGNDRLVAVCRWGVGYDTVDLEACAAAGVVVTNAPEGVRKAMAHSAIGFVLALGHRILDQDRAMRSATIGQSGTSTSVAAWSGRRSVSSGWAISAARSSASHRCSTARSSGTIHFPLRSKATLSAWIWTT